MTWKPVHLWQLGKRKAENMKETIGNVILNYQYYSGKDLYSDGPIEEELLKVASSLSDDELEEFVDREKKWEYLYHFSEIRHNIVRGLKITKEHSVLEIGAGCGAVTGALAAKAGRVTCIELSKMRSLINANRNRAKDNIEILVGNFTDIEAELQEKYDYITLIGVYEYAELYIGGDKPYRDFLLKIMQHLKPEGKIVIAIENKLGLKYWAGYPEDHVGARFYGLQDYTDVTGVRTFTRKELEDIFMSVGLKQWEFYYPHPDYKLPLMIFSDKRLPQAGEFGGKCGNYGQKTVQLFDEEKVFDTIIRNNLYPVFANSYLVIAGIDGMQKEDMEFQRFEGEIALENKEAYTLEELLEAKRKCDGYIQLQIFWDCGNGFCEENSSITEVRPNEEGRIDFPIMLPKNVLRFRIDPGNDACTIKLKVLNSASETYEVKECNGIMHPDGRMEFSHEDPWIVYENNKETDEIEGILTFVR